MADPETGMQSGKPVVAVVMGSASDWGTMKKACDVLDRFHVPYMKKVVSAHRTPELMAEFASSAREQGLHIIIAGAGGAAHLPGMIAAQTTLLACIERMGFAAVNRPDAGRYPRSNNCCRGFGCGECRTACRKHPVGIRQQAGRCAGGLSR